MGEPMMSLKNKALIASALALAIAGATSAEAAKVKCYGIAKAGQNDCASEANHHDCSGHSPKDNDPNEYKNVASVEQCKAKGGFLSEGGKHEKITEEK
jgi:uncharacterized membrane protein